MFSALLILFWVAAGYAGTRPPADMARIPAGEFLMGSEDGNDDEKPVHKVYVDTFYLDKYEVTQDEFERAMGKNFSKFDGGNLPVEKVTWFEAKTYCEKFEKRLPTEAEWEYAAKLGARGGDPREYWFYKNAGKTTHAVARKKPNALGIYDMFGNVWEWVADWYDEEYYQNSPEKNPQGPPAGEDKVLRGGSWNDFPISIRPALRYSDTPDVRLHNIGFRCAR